MLSKILNFFGGSQIHRGSVISRLYGGNYLIDRGGSTMKAAAAEGLVFNPGDRVILARIEGKNFIIGYRGQKSEPKIVWGTV